MLPEPSHRVTCSLCRVSVNPLVARYLWLAVGWRGRPTPGPRSTERLTFCGPCGDLFLDRVWPYLPRDVRYLTARSSSAGVRR